MSKSYEQKQRDALLGIRVYSAFDLPPRSSQVFSGPSLTRQEFALNGDVNAIVDQFTRTGIPPTFKQGEPIFGDVSRVPSYQEAQNIILKADKAFADLPHKVRKRLKTPAEMFEFLSNPENEDEARKLGLLKPLEASPVAPAPAAFTAPAEPLPAAGTAAPAREG